MSAVTSIAENKRITRRFPDEVVTQGKVDVIDEICAPDIVDHGPFGERHGLEQFKEDAAYLRAAFPDISVTVEDEVAEGDTVAYRVTVRGTHEGEFMGVEPTDRQFEIQNMVFFRVENGQIAERWVQPDMLGLMEQFGVVELPGE